jgi:hypothetical protein
MVPVATLISIAISERKLASKLRRKPWVSFPELEASKVSRSGKPSSTGLKKPCRCRSALISLAKRGARPHRSARHGVTGGGIPSGRVDIVPQLECIPDE